MILNFIDRNESQLGDIQMESIRDEDEKGSNFSKKETDKEKLAKSNEKRVEFSIGSPKKSRVNKIRPKSALKRFHLDTHR